MNKKIVLALSLLGAFSFNQMQAQQYLGLSNSNYSGVYGTQYNPAKLTSDKVKFAFNLASFNILVNNDYYKFKDFNNLLKSNDFATAATYDANQKTANILVSMEALLPSFQFTWGNNLGFGFSARLRGMSLGNEISSDYQKMANNELKLGESIADTNGFSLNANVFSDLGVHGAYRLIDNTDYSMSLGLGLKMYTGVAHTSFTNNGYAATAILDPNTNGDYLRLTVNDWRIMSNIKNGQEIKLDNAGDVFKNAFGSGSGLDTGKGFGGDIGVEFLLKNTDVENKLYKAKFGVSVHDIGSIRYKNIEYLKINGTGMVNPNELQIQNVNDLANYLRGKGFTVTQTSTEAQNVALPTSLNAYVDVPLSRMFYVSANAHLNLAETKSSNPAYNNQVGVVPRLETKWFDVAVPISYNFIVKTLSRDWHSV
ncbi:MAG: hypothetical protein KBA33_05805 [Cloacibacterium sp.]|nr:hypothetical protein [Cloacibacterium sp.]